MKLIATKSLKYATRRMQAGDEFDATDMHARILVGARKARYAPRQEEPKPPNPVIVPEVQAPPVATKAETDELDRLRALAERRGIHVDGRWGAARLRQEIEQAKP
jgi:hypothetical protein